MGRGALYELCFLEAGSGFLPCTTTKDEGLSVCLKNSRSWSSRRNPGRPRRCGTACSASGDKTAVKLPGFDSGLPVPELNRSQVSISPRDRAEVLVQALPYIQKFAGKTFVIKYGGAAMKSDHLREQVIRDVVFLSCVGVRPILVHGGGPEINFWLNKVGIEPQFKGGLRVTDRDTMDVAEMVLAGRVNKALVAFINNLGGKAVGLSGKDGGLIHAEPLNPELGLVGKIKKINPGLLDLLAENSYIPVVSSIGTDEHGNTYNINADTLAGDLAASLSAEKLILLTDVPGVMTDMNDPKSLIPVLSVSESTQLIGNGSISGGMVPKIGCCIKALLAGTKTSHIVDGRLENSLLLETFTEAGCGTMVVP